MERKDTLREQEKPYLSPSAIGLFWKCGEAWRRRYVCGEKIPPGVAAVTGTAVHASAEADLRAKVLSGELLDPEEVKQNAFESFQRGWENGVQLDPDELAEAGGEEAIRGGAADKAVGLAEAHHTDLAPKLNPVEGGLEVGWRLRTSMSYDLLGYIDVIDHNPETGRVSVRDLKTSKKRPSAGTADSSEQLTMYWMAMKYTQGVEPDLALDYLVSKKNGPELVQLETTRNADDEALLLHRVERAVEAIEKAVFLPASPDSWMCNPKFCGYANTCPFYMKKKTFQVPGGSE